MNYQVINRENTMIATGRDLSGEIRMKIRSGIVGPGSRPPVVRVKRATPECVKYMDLFKYSMN
ncbi:MAG: hypothetical protein O2923_09420 [Verrucomicrobia bacterium]|nr:hypothetical protein [Verrucomicrobiota bacterium]